MNRDQLLQILKSHSVELEFTKADGTLRKMKATRNGTLLQKLVGPKPIGDSYKEEIDAKHNNITVFDLEKNAFRSFNVGRLRKFQVIE